MIPVDRAETIVAQLDNYLAARNSAMPMAPPTARRFLVLALAISGDTLVVHQTAKENAQ